MLSNEKWFGASPSFYPETIDQSLRFDGSTSKLLRTPTVSGNQKKWTSSMWVKRMETGILSYLWSGASYSGNDGVASLYFHSSDKLYVYYDAPTNRVGDVTSEGRLFRDTTNWYHIVWAVDAVNTVHKIWVNGELVSTNTGVYPTNFDYGMNRSGTSQALGTQAWGNTQFLDGYMAEIVHLDGQYLDETYFGEFKNGIWVGKNIDDQNFTFGTNGFYLPFSNSSNIGYDYQTSDRSGTTNDFTPTGLNDYDVVPDSPTNNFATFNNLYNDLDSSPTYSEGNLRMDATSTSWFNSVSTFAVSSGKWYAEFCPNSTTAMFVNIMEADQIPTVFPANQSFGYSYYYDGQKWNNGSGSSYGDSWTDGDVIGVALDMDNGNVYFYKNGVVQNSGTPAFTGLSGDFVIGVSTSGSTGEFRANFGQDATFQGDKTTGSDDASDSNGQGTFYETPPSSYLALCSSNLSDTTISPNQSEQADDYFNTRLYSGDGNSTQDVTGVGFKPDFTWLKERDDDGSHIANHVLADSVRGYEYYLVSAETNQDGTGILNNNSTRSNDGFQTTNSGASNQSGQPYVSWNWLAGEAPTVDNSASAGAIATAGSVKIDGSNKSDAMAGTIAVTRLSANTKSGISIITYTGTGANGTLPHGLTSAPEMIFFKKRDTVTSWMVYNKTNGNNRFLYLDLLNAQTGTDSSYFNNTDPSSTVISLGTYHRNNDSGNTYVAFAFHSVEGYSKIGTYTGNSSPDGTFVYTGFRPAWILIKNITATGNWFMLDNKRIGYNGANYRLLADDPAEEYTGASSNILDILSNGFKLRQNSQNYNQGYTYIYMVFAEQPFKFSNSR